MLMLWPELLCIRLPTLSDVWELLMLLDELCAELLVLMVLPDGLCGGILELLPVRPPELRDMLTRC